MPALEVRKEVARIAAPLPVLAAPPLVARNTKLGDPVDQRAAAGARVGIDRIADELLVLVARHHHRGAAAIGLALGDTAPEDAPVPFGRSFVRIELRANCRVDAVGRD